MATTLSPWAAPDGSDPVVNGNSSGAYLWEMDSFRKFVAQLASGPDGVDAKPLSRAEWESLWASAQGAENEKQVVSRVLFEAYRLRRPPAIEVLNPSTSMDSPSVELPFTGTAGDEPYGDLAAIPLDFAAATLPMAPGRLEPTAANSHFSSEDTITLPRVEGRPTTPSPWFGVNEPDGGDELPSTDQVRRGGSHARARRIKLDDRRRERWLSVASWVRNIGAILILFAAWQLWGTAITQHRSQDVLKKQFEARVHEVKPSSGFTLAPATANIPDPPQGTVMAQLTIPKIGLSEYVVSGTAANDLALGPGHYLHTAQPGQAGNVAIAGHRTTHGAPFNRLAQLAPGDPIYLTTLSGQHLTYIVAETPYPVSPSNVSVLNNFGDNRLTLTTCNPEYSAVQRLIVVAAYKPPGAATAPAISKSSGTPYKLGPAATSGWDVETHSIGCHRNGSGPRTGIR